MSRQPANAMKGKVNKLLSVEGATRARELLEDFGTPAAMKYLGRVVDERFARARLDAGEDRALIHERLLVRGLKSRTAYRVIDAALCQRAPCFGTRPAHD